jgi:single-strand DNA-binding protein
MSASLNRVFVIGNLTRDPELRYIPSGQPVTSFTIAVNRKYSDQNGGRKEETTFLRVVAWAKLAEICNQYLQKGSSVFLEGRLQSRSWQAQDGTKRNTLEIIAQSVQFLSRPGGASGSSVREKQQSQSGVVDESSSHTSNDEMIIDDSFSSSPTGGALNISPDELSPDDEVPF